MKAAIYARYSSDNQREESISAQIRAIKDFAQKENIQVVKIYTDEARSATTDNRPNFLKMIKESELGLFECVIVHKLDRFSRNRYDSAFYKKKLKDNNVKLISVLEHLDNTAESIILESVLEGMAEYYSVNLSREVMKGMKETALQCKHTGGSAPLGYDVTKDKTYVVNEHEAKAVSLIFSMYADGYGYSNILNKLNSLGYKTKNGKAFGKNSLYTILTNEKYTGTYIFNKSSKKINNKRNSHKYKDDDEIIKIPDGIPRIIDQATWNKVREKMICNKRTAASHSAKSIYLLSGIIYCDKCGGSMTGNRRHSGRNKTLYETYECSTRKRTQECNAKSVSKQYVEKIVIDTLYNNIFSSKAIDGVVDKIYMHSINQSSSISEDLKLYNKQLKDINSQIDNIINAIANGLCSSSLKEKLNDLELNKDQLLIRIQEAEYELSVNAPSKDMIKNFLEKDTDIKEKSLEEQKKLIQTYVKKVVVSEKAIIVHTIVSLIGGGEPKQFDFTIDIEKYRHTKFKDKG